MRLCAATLLLWLVTACIRLQSSHAQATVINGIQCPSTVVPVSDIFAPNSPTPLASFFLENEEVTLLLEPGAYDITDVGLGAGTYCIIGNGTRSEVTISLAAVATFDTLTLFDSAEVGLKSLTLEGFGESPGPFVATGAVLTAEDVTFQNFFAAEGLSPGGAALVVDGARVRMSNITFRDNAVDGATLRGGALFCESFFDILPTFVDLDQATFINNKAGEAGGAITIGFSCSVNFTGTTTFTNNAAVAQNGEFLRPQYGGALSMGGGVGDFNAARAVFSGPLCAQGNHAGAGGNFAAVIANSVIEFRDPQNANIDGSIAAGELRGSDIIIRSTATKGPGQEPFTLTPTVVCGADAGVWSDGDYRISGPVCACDAAFRAGRSTNCSSCAGGFDSDSCSCGA